MSKRLLELNFAQLAKNWLQSKNNRYSDQLKEEYHHKLDELFQKMSNESFDSLSDLDIQERTKVINFFFYSINFLDNSTLSNIPFEIVKCLEIALKEWSEENNFIIVTSLVKEQHGFSFDNRLSFGFDYKIIETLYGINFENKLIQINIPEFLAHDYLANVVLYHELGHFIDHKFNISEILTDQARIELLTNTMDKVEFQKYFPLHYDYLNGPANNINDNNFLVSLKSNFAEYFCDLFAAQYISNSISSYLSLITNTSLTVFSPTHPSTINRNELVDEFINSKPNYLIKKINDVVFNLTNKNLQFRFEEFKSDDFKYLIPVEIDNDNQLHYLFKYGWNLWLGEWEEFERKNNMNYTIHSNEAYSIINNLIEKSIGNYIVSKFWQEINVSD